MIDDQVSPIFIQFLDCTWQLLRQHPSWFEFNAKALEFIAFHLYSAKFGTFLCNCDRERHTLDLRNRTPSLWAYMSSMRSEFTNTLFRPQSEREVSSIPLIPPVSSVLRNMILWSEYYLRDCPVASYPKGSPVPPLWAPDTWKQQRTALDDTEGTVAALHSRIQELERQLATRELAKTVPPMPPVVVAPSIKQTDSSRWTCRICSQLNEVSASRCSVCGRPRS